MNYRSIADLSQTIRESIHKLPRDIDLVVGIPRSGMLAANIVALSRNIKLTDLAGYLTNAPLKFGQTRKSLFEDVLKPSEAKHVLVVDDSIDSGNSMQNVQSLISKLGRSQKCTYCAIYSTKKSIYKIDIYFEIVQQLRLFEWNVMHRPFLEQCCLDIDGLLCLDPNNIENDDGPNYVHFIRNVPPLVIPSYRVGHLVTSRLEKYRSETEQWLEINGYRYGQLHMLDLPDAQTRHRLGCHASFKSDVFHKLNDTKLFIESEANQAAEIANRSGKPVLCSSTQKIYYPGISYAFVKSKTASFTTRVRNKIFRISRQIFKL
jgi:uncharacterized HAD superfamily protein/adenine/guanine phosphoribosyltransferase-like PRPP-binding protein